MSGKGEAVIVNPDVSAMLMNTLSVKYASFAVGGACGLFYLGCVLLMHTLPREAVVWFFNSILHGLNVGPIMRWDMPWWEAIIGVLETVVLGWLFGALLAVLYNLGAKTREGGQQEQR